MNPNARSFAFNPNAPGFGQQQGQDANQQYGQQQPNNAYYNQGFGGAAGGFGPPQGQQGGGYYPYQQQQQQQQPQQYGQQQGGYYQGGFSQQQGFAPQQQQQQQQRPPRPAQQFTNGLPPRPAGAASNAASPADQPARKPVSISIGGGGSGTAASPAPAAASSSAPRKPVSISIGGGNKPAAPAPSNPDKKPVSISIGGNKSTSSTPQAAAAKTAAAATPDAMSTSNSTDSKPAAPADPEAAEPAPAAAVSSIKAEEAAPADAAAPVAAPAAAAAAASTAAVKGKAGKQSAKIDAKVEKSQSTSDKILVEAKQATDEETLKDLFGDKAEDFKSHLNVVFIGHVDAGKSTMGGQLLYLTGMVDKRTMEKLEREAKDAGRESWYLSWALDSTPQERAKGKTVEVGRAYFETGKRRYTILDAPGHKTYVPSMISGAAQADIAILVISARRGEFETGFERGGQTREHAMLVKTAGVQRLVVVVNKMDEPTVQWSEERYNEVQSKLTPFLRSAGFNPKTDITFIPVSAYAGQNLKDPVPKEVCTWYKGPSLLGFLDDLSLGDRKIAEPLKMPVSEKYTDMGTVVVGKLESGKVKRGDSLLLMPNRTSVEVVAIYNETEDEVVAAISGDNVRIKLKGIDPEDVSAGFVLTDPKQPVRVVTQFEAQLAILEHRNIIAPGYQAVMHVHTLSEEIVIPAFLAYYDKKTGKKSRKPPAFAKPGMKVLALIETTAPVCVEKFSVSPQLGRLTVRDEGKTIAIGKVTKLLERNVAAELVEGLNAASLA